MGWRSSGTSSDLVRAPGAIAPVGVAITRSGAGARLQAVGWDHPPSLGWAIALTMLADEEVRRVIYTTDAIEAPNRQLRKAIKTKGSFPNA